MASILVFRGTGLQFSPLRRSLQKYHQLYFAHSQVEAMKILHEMTIHLIVCIVYDFIADPFSLLIDVKLDPLLSGIPVLFCAAERTMLASTLDATVARCALLCGADKYLSMDSFCLARGVTTSCKACPYAGKLCMYHELRLAIEDMLEEKDLVSILHSQPSGR